MRYEKFLKFALIVKTRHQPHFFQNKLNIQRAARACCYALSISYIFLHFKRRPDSYDVKCEHVATGTRIGKSHKFWNKDQFMETDLFIYHKSTHD